MTPDDVKVEVTAGNLVVSGEKSTQVYMTMSSCPTD
jgi:HSP20 family molecular chaperone IbpA